MGLYIVYTSDIRTRQSNTVFFFHHNKCLCLENNIVSKPLFDVDSNNIESYKKVVAYSEQHRLDAYEVFIDSGLLLKDLLEFSRDYLLDKDLSIGLLTDDNLLIQSNEELIDSYGVSHSSFHPIFEDLVLETAHSKEKMGVLGTALLGKQKMQRLEPAGCPLKLKKTSKKYKPKPSPIELDESFHDKFLKFLIESGKDNVEIYKAAGISKQVFSKILSDKDMIPTKLTVVSLCIGLRLTLRDSKELMLSAGYSLSRSLIFDSIIIKYLKDEIYDFDLINSELNEYGCPILGWHPREK